MDITKSDQQNKRPLKDQDLESNKRFKTYDGDVEVGILFKSQSLGALIGKGGSNINNIREESGAVVHTSKFIQGTLERTAKVVGSVDQVSTAIKMIIDAVCRDNPMINLLAEYKNCGNVIGKQGVTIKQIQEETGANIHVSKECMGNSTQKEITVNGEFDAVSKAIDAIVMHLAEVNNPTRIAYVPGGFGGFPNMGAVLSSPSRGWVLPSAAQGGGPFHPGQPALFGGPGHRGMPMGSGSRGGAGASVMRMEMTVWVPEEHIGKIIGRAGSTIKSVREESTAHVYVHKGEDNEDSSERKITIKGNRKSIDIACAMLENLVMN